MAVGGPLRAFQNSLSTPWPPILGDRRERKRGTPSDSRQHSAAPQQNGHVGANFMFALGYPQTPGKGALPLGTLLDSWPRKPAGIVSSFQPSGPKPPAASCCISSCACPRGCVTQSREICDGIRCRHDNPVSISVYNTSCSCTASPSGERTCERGIGRCSLGEDNG
jgi:hypothetical protein